MSVRRAPPTATPSVSPAARLSFVLGASQLNKPPQSADTGNRGVIMEIRNLLTEDAVNTVAGGRAAILDGVTPDILSKYLKSIKIYLGRMQGDMKIVIVRRLTAWEEELDKMERGRIITNTELAKLFEMLRGWLLAADKEWEMIKEPNTVFMMPPTRADALRS